MITTKGLRSLIASAIAVSAVFALVSACQGTTVRKSVKNKYTDHLVYRSAGEGKPVIYKWEHGWVCALHGGDVIKSSQEQVGGMVWGRNHYNKETDPLCAACPSGKCVSDYDFEAQPNAGGGANIYDNGVDAAGNSYIIEATAKAPTPAWPGPGIGISVAWNKSWIHIGKQNTPVAGADQTVFAGAWGARTTEVELAARINAAGQLVDDYGIGSTLFTMGADGCEPFIVFSDYFRMNADGAGSTASSSEDGGLTLGGPMASVEVSMYARNVASFAGTATLSAGAFAATGGLEGLPWEFTYDGLGAITRAHLPAQIVPGGLVNITGADIGDQTFWNSNPWGEAEFSAQAGEAVPVPEPTGLAIMTTGLAAQVAWCARRRRWAES